VSAVPLDSAPLRQSPSFHAHPPPLAHSRFNIWLVSLVPRPQPHRGDGCVRRQQASQREPHPASLEAKGAVSALNRDWGEERVKRPCICAVQMAPAVHVPIESDRLLGAVAAEG
jgi:hypothetical protein